MMNTADRIQQLRKIKGISQEELADKIGVSRQAVSKWESEQSAPDIDKIILMSDFFGVTTDYLLKGVEPISKESESKINLNPSVFAVTATALNLIGLIIAIVMWSTFSKALGAGIGAIIMVMGIMIFTIGITMTDSINKRKVVQLFAALNVWILIVIPLCLAQLDKAVFWLLYLSVSVIFDLAVLILRKIKKK